MPRCASVQLVGRVHAKGVVLCERTCFCLNSKHLLSAFYEALPSKNTSKNLVLLKTLTGAPSKNPSKKHLLLKNLLRNLLRIVRLHDPLVCTLVGQNVRGRAATFPRHKRDTSTGWLRSRSGGVLPIFFMFSSQSLSRKKPHVRNFSENGCPKFMGAWHFLVLSAGKPHARKILVLWGGGWGFSERRGGWKCQLYFYGRRDFSELEIAALENLR